MLRQIPFAIAATGLLAACSSPSSSLMMPTARSSQALSIVKGTTDSPASSALHRQRFLYIADIDGQPGLGQIHVYSAAMKPSEQIRLISIGTGRPFGLWVDANNILYVANESNLDPASVTEFKPGASSPFFTITNFIGQPGSVAVDASRNVYVNESRQDHGYVEVFAPGSNRAMRTIDTGIGGYAFDPGSMAFDPKGNLIVAESAKLALHLVGVAPGSSQAVPLNLNVTNITGPGMGVDKAGNIYVASQGGTISVFPPGATEPSRTISPVPGYGLTWVTPQGAVYQASGEGSVAEVAPGSSSPTFTLNCLCSAQGVAVSH